MSAKQSDTIRKLAMQQFELSISNPITIPTMTTLRGAEHSHGKTQLSWGIGLDAEEDHLADWTLQPYRLDEYYTLFRGGGLRIYLTPFQNDSIVVTTVSNQFEDADREGYPESVPSFYGRFFDRYHYSRLSNFRQVLLSKLESITTSPTAEDHDFWISPFDSISYWDSLDATQAVEDVLSLSRHDAQEIHSRLSDLLESSSEEPDVRTLSPASIRTFTSFLEQNAELYSPALFQADSGALRAQWVVDSKNALTILFQPSGMAEYVLFAPDLRRPSITVDHAGSASWQSVIPSLKKIANLDWLRKR